MNKIMISILVILGVSRSANVLCPFSKGSQEYGYIQVSKENKYFFAAVEAEEDPKTAPTFLLLQGGLGGSSVGLAMAEGPCFLSPVTGKPELSPYSWTQKANSIWVDAPGPSGFSEGPVEPDLNTVVNYMEKFVSQFFKDHPNFNTKVHIVGLSAAGSIAAMLGSAIVRHELGIDFKGVMLSSPIIGPGAIARGCVTMAKSLLPAGKVAEITKDLGECEHWISECNVGYAPQDLMCEKAVEYCEKALLKPVIESGKSVYDVRATPGNENKYYKLRVGDVAKFFNKPEVKAQLGVTKKWSDTNIAVLKAFHKYGAYDTTEFVNHLLDEGLKVLVVHGEQDYITNAIGALNWMVTLKGMFNYGDILQKTPFKTIEYKVSGVLGKIKFSQYTNGAKLAFIKVIEAGHSFALNQPKGIQAAFEAFLSRQI